MTLNPKDSSFVIVFPPNFFVKEIVDKYEPYLKSLMLPYNGLEDFMASTVQSITFPDLSMNLVEQTRMYGKAQEFKNAKPISDLFKREFSITFKLTDAFLNYFIFIENALNFYDFSNTEPTKTAKSLGNISRSTPGESPNRKKLNSGLNLDPIRLLLMSNEGHIVSSVIFNKPIISGWSDLKLSYSSNNPEFTTFNVKFNFFEMQIVADFN